MIGTIEQKIAAFDNLPEKQDKTFQRELIERGQKLARESQEHLAKTGEYRGIFGLVSLDREIDRSFAADPLKDPFALDRARFPIGTSFFNPRQFIYYVAPAEPTGKWRCVITLIEDRSLEVFKNSPSDMVNQLTASLAIEQKTARRPDWLRIELELSDVFVEYLKKNNFRVFPFDLLKILKGKYAARAREALKNIPIAPVEFFQEIRQIVVSSVDWNAPLNPIEFAKHILKHRNTVAAGMNKVFAQFGIKLHAAGELLFMMRDILVANEQMTTIVNGNSTTPTNELMGAGVEDAEKLLKVQEALQQVRETRTFFKQPVTYVTFRFRALIEASTGAIRFAEKVAPKLPPEARIKVQEAAGVQEEIVLEEFSYRQHLQSILGELDAIAASIERLFPAELTRLLTKIKKP